jgi:hypothetical protein
MRKILVLLFLATTPATAFDIDLSPADMRTHLGTRTAFDLAIGESSYIYFPGFCVNDNKLMAHGLLALSDEPVAIATMQYRFTRISDSAFDVTAKPAPSSEQTIEHWLASSFLAASMRPCELVVGDTQYLVEIAAINGETSLRDLLAQAPAPAAN